MPIPVGYICAVLSLLIFPPVFGGVAFVSGIFLVKDGETNHGIAQMILGGICGSIGMVVGMVMAS